MSQTLTHSTRCPNCSKITFSDFRCGGLVELQPSFTALKESAQSGCDLCHLAYTGLTAGKRAAEISKWENSVRKTVISLRGLIYDNQPWEICSKKAETVPVTIGTELAGQISSFVRY
ncbi:uncharacterized protein PV07_00872 [Cladophialophora immunda]|uniref:Uncharacterized protein n=1 Tax=Cladophialophora immunda TaxID=569365 RepID=A0A0D2B8Y4_9EURO|nr:uncharacterized protein PV07_00872 [Cladophialophora immunda]KIW34072.1 hypothetical protein PV07_00872 [Cladophialophora immunda]